MMASHLFWSGHDQMPCFENDQNKILKQTSVESVAIGRWKAAACLCDRMGVSLYVDLERSAIFVLILGLN